VHFAWPIPLFANDYNYNYNYSKGDGRSLSFSKPRAAANATTDAYTFLIYTTTGIYLSYTKANSTHRWVLDHHSHALSL
jgi:hypothetical protein